MMKSMMLVCKYNEQLGSDDGEQILCCVLCCRMRKVMAHLNI